MREHIKKEIAFERAIFFSDAIVAIAITLLALDLKLDIPPGRHLQFADLLLPWRNYLAFLLSFVNIASFWRQHHDFFVYIKKIDERMLALNTGWLLFIVVLPFSTSLLSTHFGDPAAVVVYSANILLLSIFQNFLWDYANGKARFTDPEKLSQIPMMEKRITQMLNLDMLNGLVALIVAFFLPRTAFLLLFFKIPLIFVFALLAARERKAGRAVYDPRERPGFGRHRRESD